MQGWRLTKYDPARRNAAGHYLHDEWTSVSDLGRSMGGQVLTVEAYLRTEHAYVETMMAFHEDAGAPILRACGVEGKGRDPGLPGEVAKTPPLEGQAVRRGELAALIRACLRETFWCRLEAEEGGCAIHFGYDFYVYLTGSDLTARVREVAQAGGLFLEPFSSPYAVTE